MHSADGAPRVELITRQGCHLCEDARKTVADVVARHGMAWRELSIDDDEQLRARFAEEVPVLMIDGVQRDFWVIDPDRLERLLSA
ncbi:glutaredoxin family protein [Zhihengliuella salsuginis]|uniref:Thioredoxin family protein n=1 Tax=Zhihengliuella salsuginis TaxID=578222 RepID=A0ABQ3GDZ0_9MICC|nr:glutaredoxin family protein [Zhihengliuella salsuginis]GHD03032.1 thioredoxin family protein [Zhihengliuella salsuginis]